LAAVGVVRIPDVAPAAGLFGAPRLDFPTVIAADRADFAGVRAREIDQAPPTAIMEKPACEASSD
jgi:hypothetical protein